MEYDGRIKQKHKDVITRFDGFDQKSNAINETMKGLKEEVKEYKENMTSRMD